MAPPPYGESCLVRYSGGIHHGTLDALAPFARHGLRLDGLDLADAGNWPILIERCRDGSSEIELVVDHPDAQTARDIATVARRTIWQGRSLWPGRELPIEQLHAAARAIRDWELTQAERPTPYPSGKRDA